MVEITMNKDNVLANLLSLVAPKSGHMHSVNLVDDEEWEDYYEDYGKSALISIYCLQTRGNNIEDVLYPVYYDKGKLINETGRGGDWYEYIIPYKDLNMEALSMNAEDFELWRRLQ